MKYWNTAVVTRRSEWVRGGPRKTKQPGVAKSGKKKRGNRKETVSDGGHS